MSDLRKYTDEKIIGISKIPISKDTYLYISIGKTLNYYTREYNGSIEKAYKGSQMVYKFVERLGFKFSAFDYYFESDINVANIFPGKIIQGGLGTKYDDISGRFIHERYFGKIKSPYIDGISPRKQFEEIDIDIIIRYPEIKPRELLGSQYDSFLLKSRYLNPYKYHVKNYNQKSITPRETRTDKYLSHFTNLDTLFHILNQGYICTNNSCSKNFDVNGKFVGDLRNISEHHCPGIYMSYFPENLLSFPRQKFHEYDGIDDTQRYVYGKVGLIFPAKNLFSTYPHLLKNVQDYGRGKDSESIEKFFASENGECIFRTDKINISTGDVGPYLAISFTQTELKFIRENNANLEYLEKFYIDHEDKWFIRKSIFYRINKFYVLNSLTKLPFIFITFPSRNHPSFLHENEDTDSN